MKVFVALKHLEERYVYDGRFGEVGGGVCRKEATGGPETTH